MYGTFWALVPPIIAIILALITKEIYSSMLIGIIMGALFATNFSPVGALNMVIVDGLSSSVSTLAGNFCFLVFLGILINLIERSEGSRAFGNWTSRRIKSRRGIQAATFGLGLMIFIDDYFNCMTVGSVMRPATDKWMVSRAKLAYLIDATAAPVCMIAPVSSWAAAVSGAAENMGDGTTGTQLFIRTIPYNFYSLLTFVFIISLIVMNTDFGKMRSAEETALRTSVNDREKEDKEDKEQETEYIGKARTFDMIIPVIVLIIAVFLSMLYVGGFFGNTPWHESENVGNIINALGNTDAFIALPMGGFVALLFTFIYYAVRRLLDYKTMVSCIPEGFRIMVPSILILTLAMTLKTVISSLGADAFIRELMGGVSSGITGLLPALIFLISAGFSFATGTSWGCFLILIPIVTAIFSPNDPLMIISISACLAGSICGDHCSPISDTTIMASAGAKTDLVLHVTTQLPYVLTVSGVCFVVYLLAGIVHNSLILLTVGTVLTVGTIFVIKMVERRRASVRGSDEKSV